ncbi:tRNA lysidine(34) synthetase TilS [Methylophaga sulfidovorans]|uniref:tRNA(Ile)-lysidine synthase n=1 Tax=Methylophaga sulfidovorans TaxID=45496 RepID=A0A1I3VJZ9_9GAMM|nr:tRNA lysidine(34) synthetase TilS [Methylophaga sulfidovorans]SFJ95754.1 tRNA(Ile)-lysidine synthase [Methylophaga sulfidovorans]
MSLNPQKIITDITTLAAGRPVCLAYSGGVDSHVLLHLLATAKPPQLTQLRAVHINHGLNKAADQWAQHCADVTSKLDMPFSHIDVDVQNIDELGMEAAARKARYQALSNELLPDEVLLTAQHQHDQAETLLLQLFRGAGPLGLSAMWPESQSHGMTIIRPLLDVSKQDILDYAELHQLHWVDDPSNENTDINRNYLRQEIWPLLQQRWPALEKTISRSASHCQETSLLLAQLAEQDREQCQLQQNGHLSITAVKKLPVERQRNLLRFMIETAGYELPSTAILQRIIEDVICAAEDKTPIVSWSDVEVRRYRDDLYVQPSTDSESPPIEINFTGPAELVLSEDCTLKWQLTSGDGMKISVLNGDLTMRYRQGGEKIRLRGHSQHKSLKQLFQEWSVPPWKRTTIPLFFVGTELVAVVGYGYAEHYAAETGEKGWLPYLTADLRPDLD